MAQRWLAIALVLAGALLASPTPARGQVAVCAWDRGFNFTGYRNDAFSSTAATTSFNRMTTTRANAVAIVVNWYQADKYATAIAPLPHRTPSDEGVVRLIREAKARGLKVMLRPNVDGAKEEWRGYFSPSNEAEWFASWRRMVNHYAEMSESLGVDSLQVGSEFRSLSDSASEWRRVVTEARERFGGTLIYGANWDEFESVTWWDAVDIVGIDAYFPLLAGETPSELEVVRAWNNGWMRRVEAVQARTGKPVLFPEIGYASRTRTLVSPWSAAGTPYSAGDQERALGALFAAFAAKPWFRGAYLWQWNADPNFGGVGNRDHTPQNKPTEALFAQRWWASCPRPSMPGVPAQPPRTPPPPPPPPGTQAPLARAPVTEVSPVPVPTSSPGPRVERKVRTAIEVTRIRAREKRRVRVSGRVRGIRSGEAQLRFRQLRPVRRPGRRVVTVLRRGRFAVTVRMPRIGRYELRAAFHGGPTSAPSRATPRTFVVRR